MSSESVVLVNPLTGVKEQTWTGFSWPCLLFGVFWFLYKRMWAWTAISAIAAVVTVGWAWLVFPFFANGAHAAYLRRDGWVPEGQAGDIIATAETHVRCPDCRELVRKEARKCKHCGSQLVPQ